ncbi:hypothetical protein [Paenibacillus xylanexedens]|uniref:hypothetical protein n=2 Tax=Paenibacillus TaxID=44249 RepID=UPI003D07CF34
MRIISRSINVNKEEPTEDLIKVYVPNMVEMKTILEDLQNMAIRRKDQKYSFSVLQTYLITAIAGELNTLKAFKDEKVLKENNSEILDNFEMTTRLMLNSLLQIADGIAFRFLDYDYSMFTLLQANKTSPSAILQDGFEAVLDLAGRLGDRDGNTQELITDINQVTNIGDIILKTEDYFEIIEVKKGRNKRGARINRQKERMDSLTTFINTSAGNIDGRNVKLFTAQSRRHSLDILQDCFKDAEKNGVASKMINSFQCVTCIDVDNLVATDRIDLMKTAQSLHREFWDTDEVFKLNSLDHRQLSGCSLPITVFPFDTSLIIDILMGSKIYISTINVSELISYMNSKGWEVIETTKILGINELEELDFPVFVLKSGNDPHYNFRFHIDFLVSCMMELIEIDGYLEIAKSIANLENEETYYIPFYEKEEKIWN